ncbi:MAG: NAD(P)-dependent oxidoreductase [Desulfuromonadaceae bacterium]|nr:NAD(P)-dependent oxidoreductase [Desulfuromonadaceae bacterium]MDD2855340.1 NAD(P)-dependent oxidoreductase [Desulfuromonadaceae bacterium]
MRLLVTGAGGFIGNSLLKGFIASEKYQVVGLYHKKKIGLIAPCLKTLQCDLTDKITLDEPVDFVIHCAGIDTSDGIPVKDYIETNLAITDSVAVYAKSAGVKGVIFASSISLHGKISCGLLTEHSARVNPTLYGVSKFLSEELLRSYAEHFPVVALRLCGVVGRDSRANWLTKVRYLAERGEDIDVFNADMLFNNILHTEDLLCFILMLIDNGFAGFNAFPLASKEPIPIREVVSEIVNGLDSRSRILDKGIADNSFLISNDYAINNFGYNPSNVITNLRRFAVKPLIS